MQHSRNCSLDLLKTISSFMIVCIHFKFPGEFGHFITIIARFAVPIFFMISGYFSYNNSLEKIKNKTLHIIKLYLLGFVIYFCFNIGTNLFSCNFKDIFDYLSSYFNIRNIACFLLFNDSITVLHIWFLAALTYCYVIQYFIFKLKIKDKIVYVISCILLLVNLIFGAGLSCVGIELPLCLIRNFLFMGFPFFVFGQFIRKNEDAIVKTVNIKHIFILIAVSLLETIVMLRINWKEDLYLGSILSAFVLFFVALKLKNRSYNPKLILLFNTSTSIYLIHVLVGRILDITCLKYMGLYLRPIVVYCVSMLLALIINWIKPKIRKRQKMETEFSVIYS